MYSPLSNLINLGIFLILEIWLVFLLFRRQVRRHFPVFFGYIFCATLSATARLIVFRHYAAYFYVYWWTDAALVLLSLLALNQVFRWVFAAFYLLWWFRLFYYGTIVLVLLLTTLNASINPPIQAHPVLGLILEVGVAANLLRIGIVVLFYLLTRALAVDFRRYSFGIILGFGVSSVGHLLGFLARSEFGTKLEVFANYSSAVAYLLGLAIWITAFFRAEPDEKAWTAPMSPHMMLEELEAYLKVLGFSRKK